MAGKYYEELTVGTKLTHQPGRTVTEADNVFFSCLTMNPQPLHLDFHAASKAEFGRPLVNSLLTLGIAVGLSVGETTLGTTVGDRKSTRLNSSHLVISYAVFCLKKKKEPYIPHSHQ